MKTEILLGDLVKCKYTGFKGVVINKTEFINGCIQFGIVAKFDQKAPLALELSEQSIDSQSLIMVRKGPRHNKEEDDDEEEPTGGPSRAMPKMRGR